jgi:hypothetical protein
VMDRIPLSSRCLLRSVQFRFVSYRRDASGSIDAFLGPQRDDVLEFFHHVCVGFALGHQTRAALALVVHLGDSLLASERGALLRRLLLRESWRCLTALRPFRRRHRRAI